MDVVPSYTDEQLVQELQSGDRNSFTRIYKRYWSLLYAIAYRRLQDPEQTKDILQEVFAKLWLQRERLTIHQLKPYLSSMVRYEVIRFMAKSRPAQAFFEPFESVLLDAETPDEKMIAKQLHEWVFKYADTLPAKKREIFLLHIRNKMSTKEIAEHLDISQKTVQNQLGSAMQGLKDNLTPAILLILAASLN